MNKLLKKALSGVIAALVLTTFGTTAFANGQIGTVTASTLNVRDGASTSASVITQIYKYGQVVVTDKTDGWYKVSFGQTAGWVSANYLSVEDESTDSTVEGTVVGSYVNVRTGPSTSSDIIMAVTSENVKVLGSENGWYKVQFSSGVTGWVNGSYMSIGGNNVVSRGGSLGNKIVDLAKEYLGTRYVYGGSSANGFDCSGFVKLVYNNFGINVKRVAADQATEGTSVSISSLNEGDLVFFATSGGNSINHVGIYIGNGQFIHASSGAGKVTISNLNSGFYATHFITARTLTR